jgi:acetyl-CoA C-acetyltransferase
VCDEFGLAADDPRGLTLTGGLPYFGGPGNSYSLHGIAETVIQMRDKPGASGLVGANGGVMSKYSVGVYSTEPADWVADRSKELQKDIAALPKVAVTRNAEGRGRIETYSVRYDWPVTAGVIIGRLDADGSRFMALTEDDDLVKLMTDGDPLGVAIDVTSDGKKNTASPV